MPIRRSLTARVPELGVREIAKVADREGLALPEAIRLLVAYAVQRTARCPNLAQRLRS